MYCCPVHNTFVLEAVARAFHLAGNKERIRDTEFVEGSELSSGSLKQGFGGIVPSYTPPTQHYPT